MKELSLNQMEMVSGGGCSFEDLSVLATIQLTGLGMYAHTRYSYWLGISGAATLGMFACM